MLTILPSKHEDQDIGYLLALMILLEFQYLVRSLLIKDKEKSLAVQDVTAIIFSLIILWEAITSSLGLLDPMLFPSLGKVIVLFINELPELVKGLVNSLQLLSVGYLAALVTAIPLALIIGWRKRLYRAVNPITHVLGPIPPIVYIPYAIALLPTFKMSSMFVIFIGVFWPIFVNTLNGVFNIDKRIIDSAKVLNVKEVSMIFEVILPSSLPSILAGAAIGLNLSFVLLAAAEMIGASSGLGWYIKYFSDFADYTRVIVGILFIGLVVSGINFGFQKLEKYLLRWRKSF